MRAADSISQRVAAGLFQAHRPALVSLQQFIQFCVKHEAKRDGLPVELGQLELRNLRAYTRAPAVCRSASLGSQAPITGFVRLNGEADICSQLDAPLMFQSSDSSLPATTNSQLGSQGRQPKCSPPFLFGSLLGSEVRAAHFGMELSSLTGGDPRRATTKLDGSSRPSTPEGQRYFRCSGLIVFGLGLGCSELRSQALLLLLLLLLLSECLAGGTMSLLSGCPCWLMPCFVADESDESTRKPS